MLVLDTCALFTQNHPDGSLVTVPEIEKEIVNKQNLLLSANGSAVVISTKELKEELEWIIACIAVIADEYDDFLIEKFDL